MFVINIFIAMVNLEWYRTFKSVYKKGNFSLAAKELLIESKPYLKKLNNTSYNSFKEVMRVIRKMKYND